MVTEKDIDKIREIYENQLYLILKHKRYKMPKGVIEKIRTSVIYHQPIPIDEIFSTFIIYLADNLTNKEVRKINEINFLINKFTFFLIMRLLKENKIIYDRNKNIYAINNPYPQLREYVRENYPHGVFTIYTLLSHFDGRWGVTWCKTNDVEKILKKGMLINCEKIVEIIEKVSNDN